jgi:hypothetical protein
VHLKEDWLSKRIFEKERGVDELDNTEERIIYFIDLLECVRLKSLKDSGYAYELGSIRCDEQFIEKIQHFSSHELSTFFAYISLCH